MGPTRLQVAVRRLRARSRDESEGGFTIVELMVASGVMLAAITAMLYTTFGGLKSIAGKVKFDAIKLQKLLILLNNRILGLSQDTDKGILIQAIQ